MFRSIIALAVGLLCASLLAAENPAPSLAKVYRGDVDLDYYWVSEKLDGVRALWDGAALYSRRGNRFNAPAWFVEGFPAAALDGELWMGRGTFEELSGTVRRRQTPDDAAWRRVRYMVFDLPGSPERFDERLRELGRLLADAPSARLVLVEQFRVASEAELMATLDRVVAAGGEGLMLRDGRSLHRSGRSDDLLKLKTYEDAEAVVVAHIPGKGKYADMMGSLVVEMPDGRRFKLGTGFTDAERRDPPARRCHGDIQAHRHHRQRRPEDLPASSAHAIRLKARMIERLPQVEASRWRNCRETYPARISKRGSTARPRKRSIRRSPSSIRTTTCGTGDRARSSAPMPGSSCAIWPTI